MTKLVKHVADRRMANAATRGRGPWVGARSTARMAVRALAALGTIARCLVPILIFAIAACLGLLGRRYARAQAIPERTPSAEDVTWNYRRVYDLMDLVAIDPSLRAFIPRMIENCVASESWHREQGGCWMRYDPRADHLTVVNSMQAQHEVASVLAALRHPERLPQPPGEARQRIERLLDQPIDLELDHVMLAEAAAQITAKTGLAVTIAPRLANSSYGVVRASVSVRHRPLRLVLVSLLRRFDAGFVPTRNGVILMGREDADYQMEPRVYDVGDLADASTGAVQCVIDLIEHCMVGDPGWVHDGGSGEICSCNGLGCLVVSTSDRMHREIGGFLTQLRAIRERDIGSLDAWVMTTAREQLEATLAAPTKFELNNATPEEIARQIEDQHEIEVDFDIADLNNPLYEHGAAPRISARTDTRSLRELLDELLATWDATWIVDEETCMLRLAVNVDDATMLVTRLYAVGDLVEGDQADALIETIAETIACDPGWAYEGGQGTMVYFAPCKCLVACSSSGVHGEIEELLAQLRRVRGMACGSVGALLPSHARMRIDAALLEPATFEFESTRLGDALKFLANRHGIAIQIDKYQFDDPAGLTSETPLTLAVKAVPLHEALARLLIPFEAIIAVDRVDGSEVLLVTSVHRSSQRMETRFYAASDLFERYGAARLTEMITATVQGELGWADDGGSATIRALRPWNCLCISTTTDQHWRIEEYVRELRDAL